MATRKKYVNWTFVLISVLILVLMIKFSLCANDELNDPILEFLALQEKKFTLGTQKDVILLVGSEGSGKSVLTSFLVGIDLMAIKNADGSGEYSIIEADSDDRLATFYPDLMIDRNASLTYYECTDFINERSVEQEISIAYFFNKVITFASLLKLVYVIDYNWIKTEADTINLIASINQMVTAFENIEKLKDGIAMIVTNVHDEQINDDITIRNIVNILINVKNNWKNENKNKAINFIDTLLYQNDGKYQKIGLFRKPFKEHVQPDESMPLNEIEMYQKSKIDLKAFIQTNIKNIPSSDQHFKYLISSKARKNVFNLIKRMNEKWKNDIFYICNEIDKYIKESKETVTDIYVMYKILRNGYEMLSQIQMDKVSPAILMQLIDTANRLGVTIPLKYLKQASEFNDYKTFLITLTEQHLESHENVVERVKNIIGEIRNTKNWYEFLITLFNKLSMKRCDSNELNEMIKKVKKFVSDLSEKCCLQNTIEVNTNELMDYLKIKQNNHQFKVQRSELNRLKTVVQNAFEKELEVLYSEKESKLTAKGWNFYLSDVIENKNWENATTIEIFALNSLTFDANIDKIGRQAKIMIIAPTWYIRGRINILLDGVAGKEHAQSFAANGIKSKENGKNGMPGSNGIPGGSFIGFWYKRYFDELTKGELNLRADGGSSAAGQHCGNGTV